MLLLKKTGYRHCQLFNRRINKITKQSNQDPYYILGVEREYSYDQIKQAYFKLAQEYHPDTANGSAQQFIRIKEAFELIKAQKGKVVIQSYENNKGVRNTYQSQRPNSQQYDENFEDKQSDMDYQEHVYRTPEGQEYQKFKKSFQTIHDMHDINFRPLDQDLPDPGKRFGLDSNNMKLKKFGDGGSYFICAMSVVTLFMFYAINQYQNSKIMSGYEHMYYNMLNRKEFNEYRLTLDEEDDSIEANFKQSKEVKQYQLNKTNRLNHSQDKLDRIIPSIQTFTSLKEIRDNIQQSTQ